MAKPKVNITLEEIEILAWEYCLDCINHTKQHPTASGKIVEINERKIPTISYFLKIWIPLQGKQSFSRTTYYNWLNKKEGEKLDTIKRVEGMFNALAVDIVANEGKGIFYAKNKLGMNDNNIKQDLIIQANYGKPEKLTTQLVQSKVPLKIE